MAYLGGGSGWANLGCDRVSAIWLVYVIGKGGCWSGLGKYWASGRDMASWVLVGIGQVLASWAVVGMGRLGWWSGWCDRDGGRDGAIVVGGLDWPIWAVVWMGRFGL